MMTLLVVDELPLIEGELDLSDDRRSGQLFLAAVLDAALKEGAAEVNYRPSDHDKCLTVVIDRHTYEMVPLPAAVRFAYLRFVQEIILGKLRYAMLVRFSSKSFVLERPLIVEVGGRRSQWNVTCTRDSVRFLRVV